MNNQKLLLFTSIFSYSAEAFVKSLNEIPQDEDVEIWMNSPGGSVFAGWSIIGALTQRTGKNNIKVFGDASSMAAYMLLFADNVEALDISNFTIHRADGWVDTDEEKAFLAKVNEDLRKKLEKKIDSKLFKEISGYSFDDIFNPDKRINANLDAKQAKKLGLINKIIRLEPNQIAAFTDRFIGFHNFDDKVIIEESQGSEEIEAKKPIIEKEIIDNKTKRKMTKEEIKAQYPDVYAEIYKEGVKAEKDRVEAVLEFADIDLEACKKTIESGENPTAKFFAQMSRKGMSKEALADSQTESTKEVEVIKEEPTVKTEEEKKMAQAEKEVFAAAGIKLEEIK